MIAMYELIAIIILGTAISLAILPLIFAAILGFLSHVCNVVLDPEDSANKIRLGSRLLSYNFFQREKEEEDLSDVGNIMAASWVVIVASCILGLFSHWFSAVELPFSEDIIKGITWVLYPMSALLVFYGPLYVLRYVVRVKRYVDNHIRDESVHAKVGETKDIPFLDIKSCPLNTNQ